MEIANLLAEEVNDYLGRIQQFRNDNPCSEYNTEMEEIAERYNEALQTCTKVQSMLQLRTGGASLGSSSQIGASGIIPLMSL